MSLSFIIPDAVFSVVIFSILSSLSCLLYVIFSKLSSLRCLLYVVFSTLSSVCLFFLCFGLLSFLYSLCFCLLSFLPSLLSLLSLLFACFAFCSLCFCLLCFLLYLLFALFVFFGCLTSVLAFLCAGFSPHTFFYARGSFAGVPALRGYFPDVCLSLNTCTRVLL